MKLVAEVGVGTVAAGVAKAHADVVLISGHDGGTGASPLTSIKHGGVPWELGLAETQQVLLLNGLRDRIVVQVDGQLKTGRDVVIAALLGAEEFGFATAPLVVSGCMMMRVCHLNTCPVGIATQDPELRKQFTGKPEFVENFFRFIAEEVRELMARARLPHDRRDGRPRRPARRQPGGRRTGRRSGLDFSPILFQPTLPADAPRRCGHDAGSRPRQGARQRADRAVRGRRIEQRDAGRVRDADPQRQPHGRHDARLRGDEAVRRGAGLPDDTIRIHFTGIGRPELRRVRAARHHADARGRRQRLRRQGPVGRHASSSTRRSASTFAPEENIIIGNVALYGATSGEAFFRGIAGERFAVRNSGAHAVVEGVGDHGCEYMTGGRVVVLGRTGRNFAAGMSGGVAYVLDVDRPLRSAAATSGWSSSSRSRTRTTELRASC